MRDSFLLLRDMLGHGGLTTDCTEPDGSGRVRLTLQADGTTFLRCTAPFLAAGNAVAAGIAGLGARIEAACATVAATRTLLDLLVLGATLVSAGLAFLSARGWEQLWHPLLVFAAYAVLAPLRGPLLRFTLQQALKLTFTGGKPG